MIDYKYQTIASGATPIGSAGRASDEKLLWEERWKVISRRTRKKILSPWTQHLLLLGERLQELDDFGHCISQVEDWRNRSLKKSKIEEIKIFKRSKFEEVKDWRRQILKIWSFGDSTRVCDSSRVSGATDMGMPFGYPQISILGLTH
jgi:hypothetical protein